MHHEFHDIFGDCYAAAGVGLCGTKTMQEYGGASAGRTVFVKADVQTVLILIFIVNDMLAVLHIEIRKFLEADHLIIMHTLTVIS